MNRSEFRKNATPGLIKFTLFIYILCFFIGGMRHWFDIVANGIFPYNTVPFIFNFYLTSLAIIDFIVIGLLFTRPVCGLQLAIVVMASDLSVDLYLGYTYWDSDLLTNLGLQLLMAFGLYVFISAPILIKKLNANKKPSTVIT